MTSQTYNLDGPKEFPFPYPVRSADQLTVEIVPGAAVAPGDYEVVGVGPTSTQVTVRYPNAPTSGGLQLKITRYVAPERVTQIDSPSDINVTNLNAEFNNVYEALTDFESYILDLVQTEVDTAVAAAEAAEEARDQAVQAEQGAQAAWDGFRDRYWGAYASDPSTSPTGNPPDTGDLYWNTTAEQWRVWDGGWVYPNSAVGVNYDRRDYVATAGQGTFDVTYDAGFVQVWVNGALLPPSDYEASSGTDVVLDEGVPADTEVTVIGLGATAIDVLDGDAATVTTSTGTQLLPAALDKRVLHVPDIAALRALTGVQDGQRVSVTGYHPGSTVGGGEFVWKADEPKASHNGGTVIDPDKAFPADWSVDADVEAWFAPAESGARCWVGARLGATVNEFGAVPGGDVDCTAPIQAMVNSVGCFVLGPGQYLVSNTIFVPPAVSLGKRFSGAGQEASKLVAQGMAAKPVVAPLVEPALYRFSMVDFGIEGDCESCINFDFGHQDSILFRSTFENLELRAVSGPGLIIGREFSITVFRVDSWSEGGHAFDLIGGNTTVMINCYAHRVGPGCAGYRIKTNALLLACNGIDSPTGAEMWGLFGGATSAGDPSNHAAFVTLINCNLEDWGVRAFEVRYTGTTIMQNCSMLPHDGSDYEEYVKLSNGSNWNLTMDGVTFLPSSGNMQSPQMIVCTNSPGYIEVLNRPGTMYYQENVALSYPAISRQISSPAFGVKSAYFDGIDFGRAYGFALQPPYNIPDGAESFDASKITRARTQNTVPTDLLTAPGGEDGQDLIILIQDSNTTFRHDTGGAGRFVMATGADIGASNGEVYSFVWSAARWVQV